MERKAGLYRFSFFSGSVVAGTVRLKWWRGWSVFSCFLQFAVSSLSGRVSVVGFLCFINWYILVGLWNFSRFRIFQAGNFLNSLQVVPAESGLGGPGTSAWADAAWAPKGGPRDPHWAFGGWCDVSEERLRFPGGRGKEGRDFLCDLWLGQWDFPAEGWVGRC